MHVKRNVEEFAPGKFFSIVRGTSRDRRRINVECEVDGGKLVPGEIAKMKRKYPPSRYSYARRASWKRKAKRAKADSSAGASVFFLHFFVRSLQLSLIFSFYNNI